MNKEFEQFKEITKNISNVCIVSHKRPDADTLGSAIALKLYFDSMNVDSIMACVDKPSPVFRFLPFVEDFVTDFTPKDFDLIIFVDNGSSAMSLFDLTHNDLFSVKSINIDHHSSNDSFGDLNLLDYTASSTTVIVYKLLKYLNFNISPLCATVLLSGIYSDTGSFKHSNVNIESLTIASELMLLGASISDLNKKLFKDKKISYLKVLGRVLENAKVSKNNTLVSILTSNDFKELRLSPDDTSGSIEVLNYVPDILYSVLLVEDGKGNIKASFRTKNVNLDLSAIASRYGGGGHKLASAFLLKGEFTETNGEKFISSSSGLIPLEVF